MHNSVMLQPAVSIAIGALLLAAAVSKVGARDDVASFVSEVAISRRLARPVVISAILSETSIGFMLVSGYSPRLAGAGALALAIAFVGFQVAAIRRRARPCSCFGSLTAERSHYVGLARASILALGALTVTALATRSGAVPQPLSVANVVAGLVIAFAMLVASALLDQTWWFARMRRVALR